MVDDQPVDMLKYWGGEINLIPTKWSRIYVDALFVGDDNNRFEDNHNRLRLSTEVRIFPWLSVLGGWSKTTSSFYSNLNNHTGFHCQLNFNFGAQQSSYRMHHSVGITPHYPMLVYEEKKVDHSPQYREVTVIYDSGDTSPSIGIRNLTIVWELWAGDSGGSEMEHRGNGVFVKVFGKVRIKTRRAKKKQLPS